MYGAGTVFRWTNRGFIAGVLFCLAMVSAQAAEPVSVWEVVTTYRKHMEGNRLTLMSDGKTSTGLPWKLLGTTVDFGREGKAEPRAGGAFYKGNWVGGWNIDARVVMNNMTLKSEIVAPPPMPPEAGESLIGTKPARSLNDSIVDLWEFVAVLPGTNKFIHMTCDFTPDNLVLDGDRKIGTYEIDKRTVIANFLDPQFGRVAFTEKQNNVLSGRGKPENRKYWNLQFTRVQRLAVFRSKDQKDLVLYTNNRVHSPRYTPDYHTTFNWYFATVDRKRQLFIRGLPAEVKAAGRVLTWYGEDLALIAGRPMR